MSQQAATPRDEYQRRLDARVAAVTALDQRDAWIAHARVAVFVAAIVVLWLAWGRHALSAWWVLVPVAAFAILVVLHDRATRAHAAAERGVAWYRRALDRVDGIWAGKGETGERFADAAHPYAMDLDLFGRGSLFELVSTARTPGGEETLARWLTQPATAAEARGRQGAVAALRDRLDLREEVATVGDQIRAEVHPSLVTEWGRAEPVFRPPFGLARIGAILVGAAAVVTAVLWAMGYPRTPFFVAAIVVLGVDRLVLKRVARVTEGVEMPGRDLGVLARVLERLERETFPDGRLTELQRALVVDGETASRRIGALGRLVDLLHAQRNQFFAPLGYALLWRLQWALAIEAWRARSGTAIARWLEVAGELEALLAVAGYAYEHPDDATPEIRDAGPIVDGEGLGHPLLPVDKCVRNDVRLGRGEGLTQLLVISGSNMSGKSTLLRTVGTNLVLAFAGAPVRATRLACSPVAIGATLRIQDSLQAGASRFYAEIQRLRQVVDLAQPERPLLFLLDEILAGTNSHDRKIGAEGVVRGLLARGAIGLVTTHDLALAELADALAPVAANVHFEDTLAGGKLSFDYKMRPGVVRKSNALELMRAIGLEV